MADTILVIGGSGFVGRHLVSHLVGAGYRVVVPTRRRDRGRSLFLLPTVDVVEADTNVPATLARLANGAAAVVNLVGILNESGDETFARVHVEFTRNVVEACKSAGVARLLQMSAQNADPAGPSLYLRSKGEAETIVATSGLGWTIFRPSVIFGREDSFLNLFARLMRFLPIIALGAANAKFQPVYVGDVAHCFGYALGDDTTIGQRYSLCGPRVYTLHELVRYVGATTDAARPILTLPPALSKLQALVLEYLPGKLMTRDNLASMQIDNVCDGPFPPVFGITPTALEAVAPTYLAPASIKSPFDDYRARSGR